MTIPAAIQGNYADFKLVKTRSVAQLIIEVPIERAKEVVDAFGIPQPSSEIAVAVARLAPGSSQSKPAQANPSQRKPAATRAEKARRLCGVPEFQKFMRCGDYYETSRAVKNRCNVLSKRMFDTGMDAAHRWDTLLAEYEQHTGRMAEKH